MKKRLLSIKVGQKELILHKNYYCHGSGRKCSVAHLLTELRQKGLGVWNSRHTGIGAMLVTRIK